MEFEGSGHDGGSAPARLWQDAGQWAPLHRGGMPLGKLLRVAQHGGFRPVVKSIRHEGLRRYFETGSASGVHASHANRLRMQLAALDTARTIEDMDVPGFRLRQLKGRMQGQWAVSVDGNWRLTFEFRDGDAHVVEYEGHH